MSKELAKIKKVEVSLVREELLAVEIDFQFTPCVFQGYVSSCLDEYNEDEERRVGTAAGADLIRQIMKTFDVTKLSELEGEYAYVYYEDEGEFSDRIGIFGNVGVNDTTKTFDERKWREFWNLGGDS